MSDAERIKAFICELALLDGAEIKSETRLFSDGHLDSLSLLQLVNFVEEEFGLMIDPNQLIPENWDTITQIVAYIHAVGVIRQPGR